MRKIIKRVKTAKSQSVKIIHGRIKTNKLKV